MALCYIKFLASVSHLLLLAIRGETEEEGGMWVGQSRRTEKKNEGVWRNGNILEEKKEKNQVVISKVGKQTVYLSYTGTVVRWRYKKQNIILKRVLVRVLVVQNMQFTSNADQEKARREAGQIMKGEGQTTKNYRHIRRICHMCVSTFELKCDFFLGD